jgi:hypothetical protein
MKSFESRSATDSNRSGATHSRGANVSRPSASAAVTNSGPFQLRLLSPWPVFTATLTVFVGSFLLTHNLFILIESRSYFVNGGWRNTITAPQYWILPAGYNTRFTSMLFANLVTQTCGVSVGCTNALESCLVALAFGAIVLHTFQLIGSLRLSLFAAALWALSAPALSGAIWQSIQHDKIALILTILTLSLSLEFFSRPSRARWIDGLFSLALTGLFGVAFNAKEVAFLLPICVAYLAIVVGIKSGTGVLRSLIVVVLPVVYSAWFIGFYLIHLDPAWEHHISGGSALAGLRSLLLLSLNLGNFLGLGRWGGYNQKALVLSKDLYIVFAVTVASLLVYRVIQWGRQNTGLSPDVRSVALSHWREIYLLLITAISLAAFARTNHPSPFYMMIPFWSGSLLIILILGAIASDFPRPTFVFCSLLTLMAAPLLLSYSTLFGPGGPVPRLEQNSRSVQESFSAIRALLPGNEVKIVRITVEGSPDCVWYLLHGRHGENLDDDLGPYIFDELADHPVMVDGNDLANETTTTVEGEADIRLAADYHLLSISFNGAEIYRPLRR